MDTQLTLEDLGYSDFFDTHRQKLELDGFMVARVVVEYRGAYKIKNANGEYLGKITGKHMFTASSREEYPVVGDWVTMTDLDGEHATIHTILPRKTVIQRSHGDKTRGEGKHETQIIATNVDVAFIIESIDRDFNLNRIERYCAIARAGGVTPIVVLNKIDLISDVELDLKLTEIKNRVNDIEIISASAVHEEGLVDLTKHIEKGKTYCFLGSSGVGKSSLINRLLGGNVIKTENIGAQSGRGKHTTTAREIYFLDCGGIVIDNPGMREVGMTDSGAGIDGLFDTVFALTKECRFVDCTHVHEPGCAVLAALDAGTIDAEKYANYVHLKKETEHYEMSELEKREKDRQFGKFKKTAKKELMDL